MKVKCIKKIGPVCCGEIHEVVEILGEHYKLAGKEGLFFEGSFEIVKEDEKVEKTYTTGEMIDMLLQNPKRKAKNEYGAIVGFDEENILKIHGTIKFNFKTEFVEHRWTIIEPPQEVTFAEAWKEIVKFKKDDTHVIFKMTSLVSNRLFDDSCVLFHNPTNEEIDGMWIVEVE